MFWVDRDPLGESCLPEEAPPVLSTAAPPGRLLLLTDRHASRPGALGCLPQCVNKEELHSVTSGGGGGISFHRPACGESELFAADSAPKQRRVGSDGVRDCRPAPLLYHPLDLSHAAVNKAVVPGDEVSRINRLNSNGDRLLFAGLRLV